MKIQIRKESLERVLELLYAGDPANAVLMINAILINAEKEVNHAT